jgi:hypothetical protein
VTDRVSDSTLACYVVSDNKYYVKYEQLLSFVNLRVLRGQGVFKALTTKDTKVHKGIKHR